MPGRDRDNDRHATDARGRAEAAFRKATTKPIEGPAPKPVVPGAREAVTLRIDQDVLEHFQADGPGWQDRMNAALRKAAGLG
jgi:uncharacterized protein (DUF4415 family)